MARRQRVDSATAAVGIMAAATQTIAPPVKLTKAQLPFWAAVIAGRPKAEWNDADKITAAQLARTLEQIERVPEHEVATYDKLSRLALAMRRSLGLDVRGRDGRAEDVANRRRQAFEIEGNAPFGDDLLARPSLQ